MLSDDLGIVESIGDGASQFNIGDRVCPLFFQSYASGPPDKQKLFLSLGCETDGTMAEYMVLSDKNDKLARARMMGADETINYIEIPEWGKRAREIACGDGVTTWWMSAAKAPCPVSLAVRTRERSAGTISSL